MKTGRSGGWSPTRIKEAPAQTGQDVGDAFFILVGDQRPDRPVFMARAVVLDGDKRVALLEGAHDDFRLRRVEGGKNAQLALFFRPVDPGLRHRKLLVEVGEQRRLEL